MATSKPVLLLFLLFAMLPTLAAQVPTVPPELPLAAGVAQTASIHIGPITMPFNLPTGIIGLLCVDANGVPKTGFTGHGDSAFCTVTLGAPAGAGGFAVVPYLADSPLVLNPPASQGFTVPQGSTSAKFTVVYP